MPGKTGRRVWVTGSQGRLPSCSDLNNRLEPTTSAVSEPKCSENQSPLSPRKSEASSPQEPETEPRSQNFQPKGPTLCMLILRTNGPAKPRGSSTGHAPSARPSPNGWTLGCWLWHTRRRPASCPCVSGRVGWGGPCCRPHPPPVPGPSRCSTPRPLLWSARTAMSRQRGTGPLAEGLPFGLRISGPYSREVAAPLSKHAASITFPRLGRCDGNVAITTP
jgi:hypothetical protein